jgi:hypothetical protein
MVKWRSATHGACDMPPNIANPEPLPQTLGQAAKQLGIETWQAQKAANGLNLPYVGPLRVVPPSMMPRLREACRKRGYLVGAKPAEVSR